MTIHGYRRVSGPEQALEGKVSLPNQEREIRGAAMIMGTEEPIIYTDAGVSAGIPLQDRPDGGRLVRAVKRGDTLISSKLDRLFRSASDALNMAEALHKGGINLVLLDCGADPVTGNGAAKFFFSVLAAVAEFEKGRIAERLRDGRMGKRARGGHIGGAAPYGYRIIGHGREAVLERDEAEQSIIRQAAALRQRQPASSLRALARELAGMGLRSRVGREFTAEQVRRILGGF